MKPADRWRPTPAHTRALLGGLVLAVAAVLARRPDLLVLATPLVCATVWAVVSRPLCVPEVRHSIGHAIVREGEATTWHIAVHDPEGRVDDVAAVLEAPTWIEQQPIDGQVVVSLRNDGDQPLAIVIRPTRWGRRRIGPALVVASSAWAGFRWVSKGVANSRTLVALPQTSRFDASAPPVRTPGLVGVNRSPRQGSGTEFASIRPFQPGDRLRRIHWAQSLRTGTLHVTSTWADHDRHVVLLIDALNDVGDSDGIEGPRSSSLDISLRAAGAIAEHYINTGDRVALMVIGASGIQRLPPATGRRHLRRLLEVMASIQPGTEHVDDGRMPRGLDQGALVVMLSPLVSPRALQRAVAIAERGLTSMVIDCLPPDITQSDPDDPYVSIAWRIRLLERQREIRRVQEEGIAVVPWRGPGSLDAVLRDLHRQARVRMGRHR
ncbi:MAG TPA: DUF58 domain-containing protein [Ilumatobacteraceae bacterium]|nr:DUF58 domain-containing protein [Ilumatobacteraceae bacterium]